jgi:hypothetical protein
MFNPTEVVNFVETEDVSYDSTTNTYNFAVIRQGRSGTSVHAITISKLTPTSFTWSSDVIGSAVYAGFDVTKIELLVPIATPDPLPEYPQMYDLESLTETVVTLPTGQELSVYTVWPQDSSYEVPEVSFSADFDLVVVTSKPDGERNQWGTYYIVGADLISPDTTVYIYDHNGYEGGDLLSGDGPVANLRNNYAPIAVLSFNGESDQGGHFSPTSITVDEFRGYVD